MRVRYNTKVRPYQVAAIEVNSDIKMDTKEYVFLSNHDDDEDEKFFIPSMRILEGRQPITVLLENKTSKTQNIGKGTPIGYVKKCGEEINDHTVMAFSAQEIAELQEETAICSTTKMGEIKKEQELPKLTSVIGSGKMPTEVVQNCLEKGLEIDLKMEIPEPLIDVDLRPIDIETEKEKSKRCPYWPSDKEFLENFDLCEIDKDTAKRTEKLLLQFKHIFFKTATISSPCNQSPIAVIKYLRI